MRVVIDGTAPEWAQAMVREINTAFVQAVEPRQYTVAKLPPARPAGATAFVTDEVGGPVLAFADGAAWRRCTDAEIVS